MIFSRITFAAKLSTNLVYNSIFVIDYEWGCLHLHVMHFLWSDIYLICLNVSIYTWPHKSSQNGYKSDLQFPRCI